MIYVGTAGYSYQDWVGPFYPEGTKQTQMLSYYAGCFNFVEINATYYHMPSIKLFQGMDNRTSDEFRFAVKLFGGFTHERSCEAPDAAHFLEALAPIREKGKLICLLAQFPYSFHFGDSQVEYLKRLREWFPDDNLCVEFRNHAWIRAEVIELIRQQGLGFVCVDEPQVKGLVGHVVAATSQVAYLRLHGRNAAAWYGSEGSERYNYLYSRDELLDWVHNIHELQNETSNVLISFNNHPLGKAVENARVMSEMLGI